MRIELLDIPRFIQQKGLKEVRSTKVELSSGRLDAEGLFSEEIFGKIGSPARKRTFGYIELNTKIIHPECWGFIVGINPIISKLLTGKKKYIINELGLIEESPDQLFGFAGTKAFIDNFDKLDLDKLGEKHLDYVKFIKENKNRVFIDKILVLPAGIRDIQLNKTSGKKVITSSEINVLYEDLLKSTRTLSDGFIEFMDEETVRNLVNSIQKKVIEINHWIIERMKGKGGLVRGGLLSKTVDYSARMNIVGDPTLKHGYIGLPWQKCLKLYEPFTEYQILNNAYNQNINEMIKQHLDIENKLTSNDLKRFLTLINENAIDVSPELEDELVRLAEEITKGKVVLNKRDPVENRNSYAASFIRVDRDSLVIHLNPLDCTRMGAECACNG